MSTSRVIIGALVFFGLVGYWVGDPAVAAATPRPAETDGCASRAVELAAR